MSVVYYYGQDGERVDTTIKKLFDLDEKELRWSDKFSASVFSVVGFVFKEDNILVIFPKHYYESKDLDSFNKSHCELRHDIELLYGVIKQYSEKSGITAKARSYIGSEDGYDSDYPFKPFYKVYEYFQKYGIYKKKEEKIIAGSCGKISWKRTIEKSQKIICDGNLILRV